MYLTKVNEFEVRDIKATELLDCVQSDYEESD